MSHLVTVYTPLLRKDEAPPEVKRKGPRASACILTTLGIAVCLASVAVATWMLAVHVRTPRELSSVPFGLFVLAGVAALLSANGLVEILEKLCRRTSSLEDVAWEEDLHTIPWHARDLVEVVAQLGLPDRVFHSGLTTTEASDRVKMLGSNVLPRKPPVAMWRSLIKEVHEPQQVLLLLVAVLYALVGEVEEAALALAVIVLMLLAEVITETRAKGAVASLATSAPKYTHVIRDGDLQRVRTESIVPGDVLSLRPGHDVAADAVLLSVNRLSVDESKLTGESMPVAKVISERPLHAATPLAERTNMVFGGCCVAGGRGTAVVVATGTGTELGHILVAVNQAKAKTKATALQKLLKSVAAKLTAVALIGSIVGGLMGLIHHQSWQQIVLTSLALAFATIPEELPILIAAVLAVGGMALGRKSVYVKRLRAMEALAYVDVVLADKTGTLTVNRLTYTQSIVPDEDGALSGGPRDSPVLLHAWSIMREDSGLSVDPFDSAVINACNIQRASLSTPRVMNEQAFDPTHKLAGRVVEEQSSYFAYIKGSPEAVLRLCESCELPNQRMCPVEAGRVLEAVNSAARRGMRMLAFARAPVKEHFESFFALTSYSLIGVQCFEDPVRPEAEKALADCHRAGLKVCMVTGDHPLAAAAIAQRIGLQCDDRDIIHCGTAPIAPTGIVYARATPIDKLSLVRSFRDRGHVVAVTGDGVNDAPALAEADVGIAVLGATDVAREAAGVVVVDGDFSALVLALSEGRRLYDNLVHALAFYLGAKLGLLALFFAGTVWKGFPLAPVQVIVLELFMDIGASTSFVAEPAEPGAMSRPPRRIKDPFFDGVMLARIFAGGISMAACVLGGYAWGLYSGKTLLAARSMAFVCWLLGHVTLALNQRTATQPSLFKRSVIFNPAFMLWIACVATLAVLVGTVPRLDNALGVGVLHPVDWGIAVALAIGCTFWIEAVKLLCWSCKRM